MNRRGFLALVGLAPLAAMPRERHGGILIRPSHRIEIHGNRIVDVRDFGAIGNGKADDTAAFQAAALYQPGQVISIPRGLYRITSPVQLP